VRLAVDRDTHLPAQNQREFLTKMPEG